MRKLLSFILAFTMLFTSVVASAAISADKIPTFLDKAGIINAGAYSDGEKVLTRGEFTQMISKLVTINNMQNLSDTQIFKDIPMDSELFDVTTLLNKLYFIVGDGNGYFEPEAPITAEAACKILVHLLGDQYFAQYYGGYIPAAAAKGLLNGVVLAEGQTVTVNAALKLIYNTLVADISNSNMYDGNATDNDPVEMFMSKRLGIYAIEGTVTDDGVTGLTGATEIGADQVKIGQYVFTNETGRTDLLGYTIEGFYKYNKELEKNILIYAYINENKTDLLEFEDYDIIRYGNYKYEYYTDETQTEEEEAFLNTNFKLIYNGRAYTRDTAESTFSKTVDQMLKPANGWVKLIDTDGDSYYDLVVVKSYEVVVLSSVDIENYVVYGDPQYTNIVIDLKGSEENMTIKNAAGSEFEFRSLDRGDVLSIAESADGMLVEIMYSAEQFDATLGSTDGDLYYIGEEEYRATDVFKNYVTSPSVAGSGNAIAAGSYGTFYLTFDNRIAYFRDAAEKSIKVGLLGNILCKSALDDELSFYIMTDTGSFDELKAATKVNVDGVIWKDMYALANHMVQFNKGLIRYRLNGDDEINWIDTPYVFDDGNNYYMTEPEDSLHIVSGGEKVVTRYNKNQLSFNGKFLMDSSAIQFVTYEREEFEKSNVQTYASMDTSTSLTVTGYSTDTKSMFVDYVLRFAEKPGATVYKEAPTTAVVLKIKDAIDDEGGNIKKLLITENGTHYKDIFAKPEALICPCGKGDCATHPLVVGVGDIIQYALTDDVITETIICYDYSQKKLVSPGNSRYFGILAGDTFSGEGHAWDPTWIDSMSTKSEYYSTSKNTVLPISYINKIENQAAEWAFGFWPFTDSFEISAGTYSWAGDQTSQETLRRYSMSSTYVIRVNAEKGTFAPVRLTDIKTYNNNAGVKEQGYVIWKSGTPSLLIYYK